MQDIKFIVPAVPVAQPRPRAVSFHGKARVYDGPLNSPVNKFKATCQLAASEAYTGPPLIGPVHLSAIFVMPRPQNMMYKKQAMPRVPHIKRPDIDNLAKSVMDALTGILWRDDSQVCQKRLAKVIASGNEQPHVEITVWKPEE